MGEIAKATGRTAEPAQAPGTSVMPAAQTPMELAKTAYEHSLDAKVAYAKLLAGSGLLPKSYQRQPANVLFALEYGQALGISPIAAMMGIHVIDGRPCASSGLISGLVQKAGHRLRVTGNDKTATCTITRADDPEFKFTFTWDMDRARQAGLTGKQVWKNYPAAMLRARAITEAARAAASDVLYGLGYTPEELGADALDYAPGETMVTAETPPAPPEAGSEAASAEILGVIGSHYRRLAITDTSEQLDAAATIVDRALTAPQDLTSDEADFLITELEGCEDTSALQALLDERKAIL
jgi:hypothetical protein